jgi:PTS system nitrogen regulatory IIA component
MSNETMDLGQLARFLGRDAREVDRLVRKGEVPGRKVGGEWRFNPAEIRGWLETHLAAAPDEHLAAMTPADGPRLREIVSEATCAVPLTGSTRPAVLRGLVQLAEQSWQVYDPERLLELVREREEGGSTAQAGGIAFPHPRRRSAGVVGETVVAFGRTTAGVPFGAPDRGLTDLFFLVCAADDEAHLHVLARLVRLSRRPGFLDDLRAADTPGAAHRVIAEADEALG